MALPAVGRPGWRELNVNGVIVGWWRVADGALVYTDHEFRGNLRLPDPNNVGYFDRFDSVADAMDQADKQFPPGWQAKIRPTAPEPPPEELVPRLVSALRKNPRVAHALVVALQKHQVAGPWVKADSRDRNMSIGSGFWRLRVGGDDGDDAAVIHPWWDRCNGITREAPDPSFYDDGNEDDSYLADLKAWEDDVARRKAWVWQLDSWDSEHRTEYADSKEEAMRLADAALIAEGWILSDGDPTP